MRHLNIVVRKDYGGIEGLMLEDVTLINTPMATLSGDLIAHDIMEHQNGLGSIGSVDDELEALGGLWYVRGRNGPIRPEAMHSPEEALTYEVANLFQYYTGGAKFRTPVPNTRAHIYDESFESVIAEAKKSIRDELSYQDMSVNYTELDYYLDSVLHYLRRGYIKAKRRFGGRCAHSMFWDIAEAVDNITDEIIGEGQTFVLSYDRNGAVCREKAYDYYH